MPIRFTVYDEDGYFVSKYTGKLTNDEILDAVKQFYQGTEWRPGLNYLADLSEADISAITSVVTKKLADYTKAFYQSQNVGRVKAAIFAPRQVLYGLSRMYASWSDESLEEIRLFDDIEEARKWLRGA